MATPKYKMDNEELMKSIRDAGIIALGAFIVQVFQYLQMVDFGEYEVIATVIFSCFAPFMNRFIRDSEEK